MVRETQTQHMADYKETLTKNGRKNFQKKMNARARASGNEQAMGDTIRNLNTADHYQNNFKGTAAYDASLAGTSNQKDSKLKDNLLPTFVKYTPICYTTLMGIYKTIITAEGEDYWKLLKRVAERIMDRFVNNKLTVENVMKDVYNILRVEANKAKGGDVLTLLCKFLVKDTYENIPKEVRQYYEVFEPQPGKFNCKTCCGARILQ